MLPKYDQYYVPTSDQMVNLCVGKPNNSYLPIDWFQYVCSKMSSEITENEFLQYAAVDGYPIIREKMAKWLTKSYGYIVNPNEIFMTNGISGTLHLIITKYLKAGDTILVENPSYFMSINIFKDYGLNIVGISDISEISEISEIYDRQKFLFFYTVPTHHNPTGKTLSNDQRINLAKLCEKYKNFYIISDEVYHFLSWEDQEIYPLAYYHPKIITIGSFSKILGPSLRVGWIYSKEFFIQDLISYNVLQSSGGINPIGFKFVEYALDNIESIRYNIIYRLKSACITMVNSLLPYKEKGIIDFCVPKGGYFMWIKFNKDNFNTEDFLKHCDKYKVKFHQGIKFYVSPKSPSNYIRLSFSYYKEEDIELGIDRLMQAYFSFI